MIAEIVQYKHSYRAAKSKEQDESLFKFICTKSHWTEIRKLVFLTILLQERFTRRGNLIISGTARLKTVYPTMW